MRTELSEVTGQLEAIAPAVSADSGRSVSQLFFARLSWWICPDSLSRFSLVAVLYFIASWGGNSLTSTPAVADLIWPANGVLLALILPIARRYWTSYLLASIAINTLVHLAFGFSVYRSFLFSIANTIEVLVAASLLAAPDLRKPDLTNLRTLLRFVLFGVILAPLSSAGFVEIVLSLWIYPRHLLLLSHWFTGDMMGMVLMAPLFLAMDRRDLAALFASKKRLETIAILGGISVLSTAVFTQNGLPIDFLVIPALLVAVFRLRRTGGALAILLIVAPAIYLTERAQGVFFLSGASTQQHGFFILQLFLCVNLVIVYSVDSALRARDKLHQEVTEAFHEADAKASVDYATGLANRMSFDHQLSREWQNAVREQTAISLLIVDVDHFKLYNDHYGHLAGDECLRQIASILSCSSLRSGDVVARYGGEEFAVILPRTASNGAVILAERIRQTVADAQLPHLPYTPGIVTVSIGVATMHPDPAQNLANLIQYSDRALYSAKKSGRNRVDLWEGRLQVEA